MITRSEYLLLLTNAVERKLITEDEAVQLLLRFDAGDFSEDDLPLPISEIQRVERDDDELLILLASISKRNVGQKTKTKYREIARENQINSVIHFIGKSQDKTTAQFQRDFSDVIQRAILVQWVNNSMKQDWTPEIDRMIEDQLAYIERFAADRHFYKTTGREIDPSVKGNHEIMMYGIRALMYLGAAWAAAYMGNEYGDNRNGWVWEYQPIDDGKTCSRCHEAKGYYLSGQGPMPGQICFGGWRCRCRRVEVYAPEIWRRLNGL